LKNRYGSKKLTVKDGNKASVNFKRSVIDFDGKTYDISPVGVAAQELIVIGGLENWVRRNL